MERSNLNIARLIVQLPPGFRNRAQGLVREIASQLADKSWFSSGRRERLAIPVVTVVPGESDSDLAARLADAIHSGGSESGGITSSRAPSRFRARGEGEGRRAAGKGRP